MGPYQTKDACNDKSKRKRKRRTVAASVEIKQEVVVKEEPRHNVAMTDVIRPPRQSPSTETIGVTQSEYDTDKEMYVEHNSNYVKKEVKSEDECAKKEFDSAQAASLCGDYDPGNELFGGNVSHPGPSTSGNSGQKKRQVKGKKPRDRKKETNARASKIAALKRQKNHKCHLCNFNTSFTTSLTKHIRVHTGEKPFECEVCAKAFTTKSNLVRHEKTHAPRLAFRCSKCGERFAQEADKTDHESKCQRRHFECYACKYTTSELSLLKRHMRAHSGQKPFECSVCSRIFLLKSNLHRHSRTHVKHLPLACSTCGQRFAIENEKQSHEKRCGGRRYECYLCQFECFNKSQLQHHIRAQHTGERSFQCELCNVRFTLLGNLNLHTKRVHHLKM